MEITVARQTWIFLLSIGVGACLGVCYDIFRVLRVAFSHNATAVAVEDLLFAGICAAVTFLFLLDTQYGELRFFLLAGEGIGFVLYYCTLGVLVLGAAKGIVAVLRRVFGFFYSLLIAPVLKLFRNLLRLVQKIFRALAQPAKKWVKNSNRHLKRPGKVLYNQTKLFLQGKRVKDKEALK